MRYAVKAMLLGGLAVAVAATPFEAEAGRKGFAAGFFIGKALRGATKARAEERKDAEGGTDAAKSETEANAQPAAAKVEPVVAKLEPLVPNQLVCLAGCYDSLGRPVRR